jgi:hypothetical protein
MQPPVVRKKIADYIRKQGQPVKVQDLESFLGLPYGNIMQACTRAVAAGEFVKTAQAEFGLRGVAYYTRSVKASKKTTSGSLMIPKRRSAEVRDIGSWVSKATSTGHD